MKIATGTPIAPGTAVITQPTYLPWMGYFEQIARADTLVFLDTVQFVRRSWHSRNRLVAADGNPFWLTVPVAAHPRETTMKEIRISREDGKWRHKHLQSIAIHLRKAPYFDMLFPLFETWLNRDHEFLVDLTTSGILLIAGLLNLRPRILRASSLDAGGSRAELLLNICRQIGATQYYSASGSRVYLADEEHRFQRVGIDVEYQAWTPPSYPQQCANFVSHMSVVDALMNIGPDAVRELLVPRGALIETGGSE